MKTDNSGPAFPEGQKWQTTDYYGRIQDNSRGVLRRGITRRQYLAALAMQALTTNPEYSFKNWPHDLAAESYKIADAMLDFERDEV